MPGKNTIARRIDAPPSFAGGDAFDLSTTDYAPPALRTLAAPENLLLDSQLERSAVTPTASVFAEWSAVQGPVIEQYAVQIGEASDFSDAETYHTPFDQLSITISARKTGTTYYVRVAAVTASLQSDWSTSANETTPLDTTAPGPVTSAAYEWGSADLLLTWTNPADDNFKWAQIDIYASNGGTLLRSVTSTTGRYIYQGSQNLRDTGNAGDPSLYVVIRAQSYGNVYSSSVTLSPVNAAPSAPAVAATVNLSQIVATVTSAPPLDLDVYEFVWKDSGGSTVRTTYSQGATDVLLATASDTYSVTVRVRDIFNQYSSTTTVSALVVDALTITELRSDSIYSDSVGTDFSSAPNKTVLRDDATGAGITYASSASAWRWTKIAYPLTDRFRRISLRAGSGDANFYVGLSSDDVTYTWYSGAVTGIVLTAVANEAAAQAAAPLISALSGGYAELPTTVEARYIKIGHRNTGSSYRLDEAYGQRLVIADVIKVGQLSAITADMGSITAGTITGATIQTAASGARLVLNSSSFKGYTASAQFLNLDPTNGIDITVSSAVSDLRAYKFNNGTSTTGGMYATADGTTNSVQIIADGTITSDAGYLALSSSGSPEGVIELSASGSTGLAGIVVTADTNGTIDLSADETTVTGNLTASGGLNVGSASGAATGTIRASGYTAGSILFQGASNAISQDNARIFWDNTNHRMGINNNSPAVALHVTGTIRATTGLTLDFLTAKSVPYIGTSGVVSEDNSNFWYDSGNHTLHLGGTSTITAPPRLALKGTDGSATDGPHLHAYTAADIYPLAQLLSYTHDNVNLSFDAYYDGAWKSSDAGSNWQIRKQNDFFAVYGANGVSQGSALTWVEQWHLNINGSLLHRVTSGTTSSAGINAQFYSSSTGTPAAGFGGDYNFYGDTNGGSDRQLAGMRHIWATATDASRKARTTFFTYDTAARTALILEANGSAPMIGALGAAAVARQNITGVRTGTLAQLQTAFANLLTGLANEGWITDSTT